MCSSTGPKSRSIANSSQDKKLLRKLDLKLIPWLSFLYLICEFAFCRCTMKV